VNPLLATLTRIATSLANGAADLDPLSRARLHRLAGRSVAVEVAPPGEAVTIYFDAPAVRIEPGVGAAPSAIVRGTAAGLVARLFGGTGQVAVEGDELILTDLIDIVRQYRPDLSPPLDGIVGRDAAGAIASLFELGVASIGALGRSIADEGSRLARSGAGQRYLSRPDFETWLADVQALQLRIDRAAARTTVLETGSRGLQLE
jgi:ubiquinone biosynthesis protein UbiJ